MQVDENLLQGKQRADQARPSMNPIIRRSRPIHWCAGLIVRIRDCEEALLTGVPASSTSLESQIWIVEPKFVVKVVRSSPDGS